MIFFCAINDISKTSKFYISVEAPTIDKNKIRWGITELSSATFSKIENSDYVFFYCNGNIIGIGKVLSTYVDKELSEKLWGINKHKLNGDLYWSNIINFSEYNTVLFPFSKIIEIGNYSSKFSIRRIIGLNTIGTQRIIKDFCSDNGFVEYILTNFKKELI